MKCWCSSKAEHFLGKEEGSGPIPVTSSRFLLAGMAEWLGTRFPPWKSEFDSPCPLYAGVARRSSTWLPSTRRGFDYPHLLHVEVPKWQGNRLQNGHSRVRSSSSTPRLLCRRHFGVQVRVAVADVGDDHLRRRGGHLALLTSGPPLGSVLRLERRNKARRADKLAEIGRRVAIVIHWYPVGRGRASRGWYPRLATRRPISVNPSARHSTLHAPRSTLRAPRTQERGAPCPCLWSDQASAF